MKKRSYIGGFLLLFPLHLVLGQADSVWSDTLLLEGQLSVWMNGNTVSDLGLWTGGSYIPRVSYALQRPGKGLVDFQASAQLNGLAGFHATDSIWSDGKLKPYRLWARYASDQLEFRVGLQKINFGSAAMLRPLMWFDRVDPRDPLRLTDGVWGALLRYYFLNNATIWLWGLYGNKDTKGWETIRSNKREPELGARVQVPIPFGEGGLSYHHRTVDTRKSGLPIPSNGWVPEDRLGIDLRFDWILGNWLEASWIRKDRNMGMFSNQELLNLGADCTFPVGEGLYAVFEQLLAAYDVDAFDLEKPLSFSLLSLMYPVSLFDRLNAIVYYDWTNRDSYHFVSWQHDFNRVNLFLMVYWNPETYSIPTQVSGVNLLAGKGVQVMGVWYH